MAIILFLLNSERAELRERLGLKVASQRKSKSRGWLEEYLHSYMTERLVRAALSLQPAHAYSEQRVLKR